MAGGASKRACALFPIFNTITVLALMFFGLASTYTTKASEFTSKQNLSNHPRPSFLTITEFLAIFLGCGHGNYDPTTETSPLSPVSTGPSANFEIGNFQNFSLLMTRNSLKNKAFNFYESKIQLLSPTQSKHAWLSIILILSGDLHQNPGPRTPKVPCGICKKACTYRTPAVACDELSRVQWTP